MSGVFYRVEHVTDYEHSGRVSTSQHVAYLQPRVTTRQTLHWHRLDIDPEPDSRVERVDYFGNAVCQFSIATPYRHLRAMSSSLVEVRARDSVIEPENSPAWETVRDDDGYRPGVGGDTDVEFRSPSPYVAADDELAAFASRSFTPGRPLLEAACHLMHRIHEDFEFDATATSITTPVARVIAERRGVCQDFAHLQIGCLRSMGIAARYVSGYLLTDPPPGQPRLVGADASHAWLSVRCPRQGWIDLDPTNDTLPDSRHIVLAWGRDYGDVSPLRGVVLGGQEQRLRVGVSVMPAEPSSQYPG